MSVKRFLDIIVSLGVLTLGLPVLLVVGALVRMKIGSPVLFWHTRPGLQGKPFRLVKFRSMTQARDSQGNLLSDEARTTPFGQRLRQTGLDEIPEFWNILRGDMSLVGPRPLLMEYVPRYSPEQARRMLVRPGLTGMAQVSGESGLEWNEKFRLDVWYVDNQSLALDLKIIFKTAAILFKRAHVDASKHVPLPFLGDTAAKDGAGDKVAADAPPRGCGGMTTTPF